MFNISLDSVSFRLEANKLLGPAFICFFKVHYRALAYANKAVLFCVQLYEIVDVYNRFEKFSNLKKI